MSFLVTFNNQKLSFEKPVSILEIVGDSKEYVCANVNNRLRELTYMIDRDCEIEPLTCKDRDAMKTYEASLRFLVAMAMHNIRPDLKIRFSYNVSRSVFMQIISTRGVSNAMMVDDLKKEMDRLIALDLPLNRKILSKDEVYNRFKNLDLDDKADIMQYRPEKTAHLYECNGYFNYMYNRMVPSTGYITKYNLKFFHPGIIIQYPRSECNGEIPPFEEAPTYGKTLKQAHEWAKITGADTIVGINRLVEKDGPVDFINLCEARHNSQLTEIGDLILEDKENIRLICIAGPSSSGKTTFANRLRIELLSRGIKPIRISMDDFYLPKDEAPLDENGEKDLESVEALDIPLFNKCMSDLISGCEVTLPRYDFTIGRAVPGRTLKLDEGQPIIVEGIHALNDTVTSSIPNHQKFKIYIAPQAQINIDNDNPLSLSDLRLLRRIVRDYQFRGASAEDTLKMWKSVRKGEFKWIYKTQEGANYVFNSLLPYELSCMKKFAMPLLDKIDVESPLFPQAERLIRMLKFFKDMSDEWVPCNSLMREFIGGSCYADV